MMLKILLNAGTSPNLGFAYVILLFIIYVKIAMTRRKSAGVRRSLHTSVASKRLHAGDLNYAYIVGLFEGDGYFSITKKGKYLTYEIGIEMSIKDVQLMYKIKNILGVGIISFRKRNDIETVLLRIRDKNHLKNFILPIFDKYPMFSAKQYDYLRLKDRLISNIIYSKDLPDYKRSNIDINNVEQIVNAPYFSAWLIGFIEAEGCFSTYKLNPEKEYLVGSFDIAQKHGKVLILAIKEFLGFTTKIYLDTQDCYKLKVTSKRSLENIIKYLDKAPVKFLGKKKLQYILWLKTLRKIPRYSENIKIPSNY